jgi:hypothetical protein
LAEIVTEFLSRSSQVRVLPVLLEAAHLWLTRFFRLQDLPTVVFVGDRPRRGNLRGCEELTPFLVLGWVAERF